MDAAAHFSSWLYSVVWFDSESPRPVETNEGTALPNVCWIQTLKSMLRAWGYRCEGTILTICFLVYEYGSSALATVSFFQFRAFDKNPVPGRHSGRYFRKGNTSTRKVPGTPALLKLLLARSMSSTKSSRPSFTSYPYVVFRMTPPAFLTNYDAVFLNCNKWTYFLTFEEARISFWNHSLP